MGIKCSACGSTNTKIVPWKDLEKHLDPKQKNELILYHKTKVDPGMIIEIIKALAKLAVAIFDFFTTKEKNRNKNEDKKYVVCQNCGTTKEI